MKKPNYVNTNIPGYVKDTRTNAIINMNMAQKADYQRAIDIIRERKEHEQTISSMRNEIDDLKNLIKQLLDKR